MHWTERLKGIRTTTAFSLVIVLTFISLWVEALSPENTVEIVKWTFTAFVGVKAGYKVTEVVKEKMNGKKG